ncbi:MAG: hypothetical protein WKF75_03395 [Singulisphaera sp.]
MGRIRRALIKEWKERHSDAVLSLDFPADGKSPRPGATGRGSRSSPAARSPPLRGHTHRSGRLLPADERVLATAGATGAVTAWT